MTRVAKVLDELKEEYLSLYENKEDLFWRTKMGISEDLDKEHEQFVKAEVAFNRFMQSPERLKNLREAREDAQTEEQQQTLDGWIRYFAANVIETPEAQALSEEIVTLEKALERKRGGMNLGYIDPANNEFVKTSSIGLGLMMRTDTDEARRKAAYEGLQSIENFVLEAGFLDIIKKRNELGRSLGYEDYYDWRVSVVEQMRKKDIFDWLDDLERKTADKAKESLMAFQKEHGESVLEPWNFMYARAGNLTKELDPYFSFGSAVERWGRSFAALGITFRDATLTLDLLDREGKYENGFMHCPGLAFYDKGAWKPARINFTANAAPSQVGGGLRALKTLLHEGGHAAHFSNITMNAPCFSHEFAPTSVAYAETQSMFLDSLMTDADWRRRYALNADGEPIPMSLIERTIRENQPFMGWGIRSMVTIPFGERALYECPEDKLEPGYVLEAFRGIEQKLQGLSAGVRPILSVPHLLSGEASAYYHAYIIAEMAVYQTRKFFLERDGHLTDNPNIGTDLATHYWASGNSKPFQQVVQDLTGTPLSADALVDACNMDADTKWEKAQQAVNKLSEIPAFEGDVDLEAQVRIIHGRELVASNEEGSFEGMAKTFDQWVEKQRAS